MCNVSQSSVSSGVRLGLSLSLYLRSREVRNQSNTTSSFLGMKTLVVKVLTASLHLTCRGREEESLVCSPVVRSDPCRAMVGWPGYIRNLL